WCIYTDPEVAHVGLSEKEAEEKGIKTETIFVSLENVDRAVLNSEENGFLKVVLKKRTDKIIGATLVTRHAGEIIGELALAVSANIGLKKLSTVIHPYPTQAEVIKKAADTYNRSRLTPLTRWILGLWMRWSLYRRK
ncbi:MAG TPA: FAD-containing oxidoreductase, partial [Deltaproteobacteria bacterium]|nr:FAD-containing oxidoreductase [Deltaproteobacteria bacterium]